MRKQASFLLLLMVAVFRPVWAQLPATADSTDGEIFNSFPEIGPLLSNDLQGVPFVGALDVAQTGFNYRIFWGKNNTSGTLKKPFYYVEGIDVANTVDLYDIKRSLNRRDNLLEELHDLDYDVILLDYKRGAAYIQDNAMALVTVLEFFNKFSKSTTEENIVMGFSMGGLVARYALLYMEANGMDHETSVFIAHDSPQRGANVPLGVQNIFHHTVLDTEILDGVDTEILDLVEWWAPAAQQMAIYHYSANRFNFEWINNGANITASNYSLPADVSSGPYVQGTQMNIIDPIDDDGGTYISYWVPNPAKERVDLLNELFAMSPSGYPENLKRIATSNGDITGSLQPQNPDQRNPTNQGPVISEGFVNWDVTGEVRNTDFFNGLDCSNWWAAGFCALLDIEPVVSLSQTARIGFPQNSPTSFVNIDGTVRSYTYGDEFESYDEVSGSYMTEELGDDIEGVINGLPGTWTSSVTNGWSFIPTISALDIQEYAPGDDFSSATPCKSTFDDFKAREYNFLHNSIDGKPNGALDFIKDHIDASISTPITGNSTATLTEGTFVSGGHKILKANNSVRIGGGSTPVFFESGSQLLAKASNTIILESGVILEEGSNASISIVQIDDRGTPCYTTQERSIIPGDFNEPIDPNVQQARGGRLSLPEEELALQVSAYPNPTKGIITVDFTSVQAKDAIAYLYNSQGRTIKWRRGRKGKVTFDISSFDAGMYTVIVATDKGNYRVSLVKE
ncbi:MAG: T9SS type A sorting domain-containing protein [Bacteroidota bacterium]